MGDGATQLNFNEACLICFDTFVVDDEALMPKQFPGCCHRLCKECMNAYLEKTIMDGKVMTIRCPQPECRATITKDHLKTLMPDSLYEKYERFLLDRQLQLMPNIHWCPKPGCGNAMIVDPKPQLLQEQKTYFARQRLQNRFLSVFTNPVSLLRNRESSPNHHNQEGPVDSEANKNAVSVTNTVVAVADENKYVVNDDSKNSNNHNSSDIADATATTTNTTANTNHGNNNNNTEYRESSPKAPTGHTWKSCRGIDASLRCAACGTYSCYYCGEISHSGVSCEENKRNLQQVGGYIESYILMKPCPRCHVLINKEQDGSCNHMACSRCDCEFCWLCLKEINDLHFLTPTGCTYFSEKSWGLKKKAASQTAVALLAPVAIGLAAVAAIPSIIIAVPYFIGKHEKKRYTGKKGTAWKTMTITGGVIISPVVAGLAVGLGVPLCVGITYVGIPIYLIYEHSKNRKKASNTPLPLGEDIM